MPSTAPTSSTSEDRRRHVGEVVSVGIGSQRPVRVLFVCTANRIRSPFAAALATRLAAEHGLPVEIGSAGLTSDDEPAAESMIRAAQPFDVDLSTHRNRVLTTDLIDWADLIVTMTGRHVLAVVTLDTGARTRTLTLGEWAAAVRVDGPAPEWAASGTAVAIPPWTPDAISRWARRVTDRPVDALLSRSSDIADPVGRSARQFRHTAQEIDRLLRECLGVGPA